MSSHQIHSTGRGGAGNIGHDINEYTDGGIIREGVQGESVEGNYSTGRGGTGNIPTIEPKSETRRRSTDVVPEINQRNVQDEFHTGRGGAGNVHKEKQSASGAGLTDKIKHALHLDGKKETNEPAK